MALGALLEGVAESATTWHSLVIRQHGASRVKKKVAVTIFISDQEEKNDFNIF